MRSERPNHYHLHIPVTVTVTVTSSTSLSTPVPYHQLPRSGSLTLTISWSASNTDYRLLARIIAARLSRALSTVIHPSQTAFLKGQRIGDNISMLQLLPDALQCMSPNGSRSHCMIAFLDFAKAYDTVSRPFMKAVMTQMGVGVGFLN